MNGDDPVQLGRPGSYSDLARRMDKIEQRHETLEDEVRTLSVTVSRVETNQKHAEELNRLRFDALDRSTNSIAIDVKAWMTRIEGVITGDIKTAAAKELARGEEQGQELIRDYRDWRREVNTHIETAEDRFRSEDHDLALRERTSQASARNWGVIAGIAGGLIVGVANIVLRLTGH